MIKTLTLQGGDRRVIHILDGFGCTKLCLSTKNQLSYSVYIQKYLLINRQLLTFFSHNLMPTWQSAIICGAFMFVAGTAVNKNCSNLSTDFPWQFPIPITFCSKSTVGRLITQSPLSVSIHDYGCNQRSYNQSAKN